MTLKPFWHRAALLAITMLPAACASFQPGARISLATADGSERYTGERSTGFGGDRVALTSPSGSDCAGELHPTVETATMAPAAFGGVVCEDGRSGILLFSGGPDAPGGQVTGVMQSRDVSGFWGQASLARRGGA